MCVPDRTDNRIGFRSIVRESGLTLVEVLIASTLMFVVVGIAFSCLVIGKRQVEDMYKRNRSQVLARCFIVDLEFDLRSAKIVKIDNGGKDIAIMFEDGQAVAYTFDDENMRLNKYVKLSLQGKLLDGGSVFPDKYAIRDGCFSEKDGYVAIAFSICPKSLQSAKKPPRPTVINGLVALRTSY